MTEAEAIALADRNNAEHPDRRTHHWLAREGETGWDVVKIGLPVKDAEELHAEQRAEERPPTGEDPRSSHDRNVGPWGGGGGV
jgi:hypothetical protein